MLPMVQGTHFAHVPIKIAGLHEEQQCLLQNGRGELVVAVLLLPKAIEQGRGQDEIAEAKGRAKCARHTNFLLCKPPVGSGCPTAEELYDTLMKQNIYVRYYKNPRLRDYLRITIGTDAEMDAVLMALGQILGHKGKKCDE
ncbi:hypothetical protein [Brevibacillus sp. SIMBA_040]|uniref:hypothetical protein n=1 Tax=unclassified Brevibacillus TaxID=2684853 RepID=UPI00397C743F